MVTLPWLRSVRPFSAIVQVMYCIQVHPDTSHEDSDRDAVFLRLCFITMVLLMIEVNGDRTSHVSVTLESSNCAALHTTRRRATRTAFMKIYLIVTFFNNPPNLVWHRTLNLGTCFDPILVDIRLHYLSCDYLDLHRMSSQFN